MNRRRWTRGGGFLLLLGTLVLMLSGCSVSGVEKHLRFGWPTGVTKQAERMRVLWSWSGVAALALGVVVWGLIFWACIRHRKRNDELPRQTKYNFVIEMICVTVPFIVIVVLFWRTVVVEDYVNRLSAKPDVLIQVDAFKWNWQFEYVSYKDAAGKTTRAVYPNQTNEISGTGNALNLSTVGSDGEIPILVLPVGKSVQVIEHSDDVVHSFWVPEFLFKRDVIPYGTAGQQKQSGLRDNRFQFTATAQGSYVGRCAELCGTYHSQMNFEVRVVSARVFTNYLDALRKVGPDNPSRQSIALTAAGMTPRATTTYPFSTDRTARSASQKSGNSS